MGSPYWRDHIDWWFDCDVYLPTRTLYIGSVSHNNDDEESGVDHALAERVIKGLHLLEAASREPIGIALNSPGGEYYHCTAICDAIRACKSRITITVYGQAQSCGSIILQAADHRVLTPHATLMLHYGTGSIEATQTDVARWAAQQRRTNIWVEDLYLKRIREQKPRFRRAAIQAILEHDTYYDAEEAVEIGLADEVMSIP